MMCMWWCDFSVVVVCGGWCAVMGSVMWMVVYVLTLCDVAGN